MSYSAAMRRTVAVHLLLALAATLAACGTHKQPPPPALDPRDIPANIDRIANDVLAATGVPSASVAAVSDGKIVLKEIDRIAKKYKDDPKVQEGAEKYRKLTTDQMVEINLHLASLYTTRSSFNDAVKSTNAALALDPNNAAALAQRARIEQTANEGIDWRWR